MTSLPSLLGATTAVLQSHSLCEKIISVETKEFSSDQFFFKIRAELAGQNKLQVRIYYNRGHIDYAYQLFTDIPLLRWDNKEEFRQLATYPHHHHDERGSVHPSPLTGDPIKDLAAVLQEVSKFISGKEKDPRVGESAGHV